MHSLQASVIYITRAVIGGSHNQTQSNDHRTRRLLENDCFWQTGRHVSERLKTLQILRVQLIKNS
jgi:hypothetical protein